MRAGRRSRGIAVALATAAVGALGCSKSSPTPPTTFGVNITVDASKLSPTQRSMVKLGSLLVSGAESLSKQFNVYPEITGGQLTFQYLPAATVTSGTENFQFDAIDSAGALWGTGTSGPVVLVANMAATAKIILTPEPGTSKAIGAKCNAATECVSGFCTDSVCCQEACQETCASCAITGTIGLCTAYPADTDPDKECVGLSMTSGAGGAAGKGAGGAGGAGGAPDAGAPKDASATDAEAINTPDGGIIAMPSKCGGTCNGMKACAFANVGTSCGTAFCNTRKDVASPVCDGKGACAIGLADCTGGYSCNEAAKPGACRTTCSANAECLNGYYCNGTSNACVPTKTDGISCQVDAECNSGHCANNFCCNTACDQTGTSCNNPSSPGKCQCTGVTCGAGVACQIFYQDSDGDGYGNRNGTISAGTAKAGCAGSTPPVGFVADNTDCEDGDPNVHPGQTTFFAMQSPGSTHTWDYDCDGIMEKGIPEYPGASCTFCPGCSACGPGATTCSGTGAQASLACPLEGGICLANTLETEQPILMSVIPAAALTVSPPIIIIKTACCGCDDHAGFNATVACGQSGTYVTCGTCGASGVGVGASGGTPTGSVNKPQTCR
jgi:hypothetical protein